jgi:UDPglucose--hexose-1-phosphate uridylyltransferase
VNERRRDPISGQWRVVATTRQERIHLPTQDRCPLCPTGPGGPATEIPWPSFAVAVFDNRFPAFTATAVGPMRDGFFAVSPATGAAEVIVYSDDHEATLAELGRARLRLVVDVWADRYQHLADRPEVHYVFIFENRGEEIGVTLQHAHGQIYGYPEIPPVIRNELDVARRHLREHGTCVSCDVVAHERADGARVVSENATFLAFVPFAARVPFEVHIASYRHVTSLLGLSDEERDDLAAILERVLRAYDRLFGFRLPYVMSVHQEPTVDGDWRSISHLHVEFTPIHRSEHRLKFLAGSELGAGIFLNDVAPEEAAARLRDAVTESVRPA